MFNSYHLSPEHPCPTAADECYTLTKHILLNGNKYGLDSKRIIVMGDSAGGNLAASTSLRLAKSDPDINQPKFQVIQNDTSLFVDLAIFMFCIIFRSDHNMLLLTNSAVFTTKFSDRSFEVWTE